MRLLLLLTAIIVGLLIVRQLYRSRQANDTRKIPQSTTVVRCEQCGVHVPKDEALHVDGKFFCSDEHRKLHQR